MKRSLIVLTCTVNPSTDVYKTRRFENDLRLRDYKKSIEFWIRFVQRNKKFDLLILENSSSISKLQEYVGDYKLLTNIKFGECQPDEISQRQGISGGELKMLRESNDFFDHKDYGFVWKVTGRSRIANIRQVLCSNDRAEILADRVFVPRHALNSRIFGMSPELWEEFTTRNIIFDEGDRKPGHFESMEHYLTMFALEMEFLGYRQRSFLKTPIFLELSGSKNKSVDSIKRRLLLVLLNPIRPILIKLLLGSTP